MNSNHLRSKKYISTQINKRTINTKDIKPIEPTIDTISIKQQKRLKAMEQQQLPYIQQLFPEITEPEQTVLSNHISPQILCVNRK